MGSNLVFCSHLSCKTYLIFFQCKVSSVYPPVHSIVEGKCWIVTFMDVVPETYSELTLLKETQENEIVNQPSILKLFLELGRKVVIFVSQLLGQQTKCEKYLGHSSFLQYISSKIQWQDICLYVSEPYLMYLFALKEQVALSSTNSSQDVFKISSLCNTCKKTDIRQKLFQHLKFQLLIKVLIPSCLSVFQPPIYPFT